MIKEMLGMNQGILKDLHEDHQEVAKLIEQIIETEDSGERTALFKDMMTKLLAHSHAEQHILYRKLEKSENEEAREFGYEGDNEHQLVEQQLQQMARARNKTSEQWTAQAKVLRDLVAHHVEEEESTGFSCSRKEFDADMLEKLGEQFRRDKEKRMAEAA